MKSSIGSFLVMLFIGPGLLWVSEARAIPITTEVGNGADTYVQSTLGSNNASNQNYGTSEGIFLKHDTAIPGNNRKSYVRFDLAAITLPIFDASLDLVLSSLLTDSSFPHADPSTYNVFGLNDGHPDEAWDETTITWNNAPGNDPSSAGGVNGADTLFLGTFSLSISGISLGDIVSFSSASLINFLQADSNDLATLIITRQEPNFSTEGFASKEHPDFSPPTLNVTISDVLFADGFE